jgi:hypothetical protein
MLGQRRFGKLQTAVLIVIALVMGANLISPAVAHVTRRLNHLYKHLDPRYLNIGETAQNANALGGKSLDAVLPRSASAENATVVGLVAGGTIVVQTTITTTATSRILATGAVELSGAEADERALCNISIGGVTSISYETTFDDIGANNETTIPVTFGRENVPAGANIPVVFTCSELAGAVAKDDAALTVVAIPNP